MYVCTCILKAMGSEHMCGSPGIGVIIVNYYVGARNRT